MPLSPLDVTVIVTCYNHQAYVEQCLASVAGQTIPPAQVIIVDDNSPDDSAAVIASWIERHDAPFEFLHRTTNGGVCTALNQALGVASGRFICHISADDWLESDRLERQVRAFEQADDAIAFVVSDIREVDAGGFTLAIHDIGDRLHGLTGPANRERLHLALLDRNLVPAPGVLMRTAALRSAGGYDETLSFEDYDMWLRLTAVFAAEYVPGIVSDYRLLQASLTRSSERQAAFLATERRCLVKQRGTSPEADAIILRRTRAIDELASAL